jgi:cell division protein FtsB
MSTAAGSAYRPRPTHDTRPDPRRRLRAVTPARRASRLPFIVLAALVVVAGVLGLVSLNVNVNQQAFTIAKLQRGSRDAENRYASLQAEVDRLKSPDRIAREAARRHLLPAGRPRVARWPGAGPGGATSPGAATSPAAPGAGSSGNAQTWPEEPNPLKQYLAEP